MTINMQVQFDPFETIYDNRDFEILSFSCCVSVRDYGCPFFVIGAGIIQLTVVITTEQCNNPYAEKHSTP